jgi:hypothetical protein
MTGQSEPEASRIARDFAREIGGRKSERPTRADGLRVGAMGLLQRRQRTIKR